MNVDIINRFWNLVDKSGECWIWKSSKDPNDYPRFWDGDKFIKAHRFAWMIENGDIPSGDHCGTTCVLHSCDTPACCNPSHLRLGTQKDNMSEASKKGRMSSEVPLGTNHGMCKITEDDVHEIRKLAKETSMFHKDIGKMFGLSQTQISRIVKRDRWAHI